MNSPPAPSSLTTWKCSVPTSVESAVGARPTIESGRATVWPGARLATGAVLTDTAGGIGSTSTARRSCTVVPGLVVTLTGIAWR